MLNITFFDITIILFSIAFGAFASYIYFENTYKNKDVKKTFNEIFKKSNNIETQDDSHSFNLTSSKIEIDEPSIDYEDTEPEFDLELATKIITEKLSEKVTEPVIEPAIESVIEPAIESVIEPVIESVIEPAIEPVIEPAIEPVIELAIEPVIELAIEPVIDNGITPQMISEIISNSI